MAFVSGGCDSDWKLSFEESVASGVSYFIVTVFDFTYTEILKHKGAEGEKHE